MCQKEQQWREQVLLTTPIKAILARVYESLEVIALAFCKKNNLQVVSWVLSLLALGGEADLHGLQLGFQSLDVRVLGFQVLVQSVTLSNQLQQGSKITKV